jgi:hypothetical protein
MTEVASGMNITFRCPPHLEPFLPRPSPALLGLPDWFKALPASVFSRVLQQEQLTVKKCPPFIDAMTYGFLIPLVTDIKVEDGAFAWDFELPAGAVASCSRSPLDFHDSAQVAGTPFFRDDTFVIKFNNFWTIETPPGYSSHQSPGSAVHDTDRADRHRSLQGQLHQLSGALARPVVSRRAAEGHADRAVHPGETRILERSVRHHHGRRGRPAAGHGRRPH